LFYFPNKQYLYCHNCTRSWRPIDWIKEVSGLTLPEIIKKNKEKIGSTSSVVKAVNIKPKQIAEVVISDLPENSIDLTDPRQVSFYKDNKYVKLALECCANRKLLTAINSCNKFYISLEDKVHKNRLVIPFYSRDNKIVCYQTRALTDNQFPRYLTKFGEKSIFNINNVNSEIPYVFVFEGPIDSMFIKNGVAMAAISPTEEQERELKNLLGYELIYIFDNDKNNKQTTARVEKHIRSGKRVFIWPKELNKYKDFNEVCCSLNINEISWQFVVKNSNEGPAALLKQKLKHVA
jgi:DNA primase